MSVIAAKLCSLIIQEHFGDTVKTVCENLYSSKWKAVSALCSTSKLCRKDVNKKHNLQLVSFMRILTISQFIFAGDSCTCDFSATSTRQFSAVWDKWESRRVHDWLRQNHSPPSISTLCSFHTKEIRQSIGIVGRATVEIWHGYSWIDGDKSLWHIRE